jgi:hypothetical protein
LVITNCFLNGQSVVDAAAAAAAAASVVVDVVV